MATDVGGFPDLIDAGQSGLLIPAYSENALFSALVEAVNAPAALREQWGRAAREKVLACFQETHEKAAYTLVYEQALGRFFKEKS